VDYEVRHFNLVISCLLCPKNKPFTYLFIRISSKVEKALFCTWPYGNVLSRWHSRLFCAGQATFTTFTFNFPILQLQNYKLPCTYLIENRTWKGHVCVFLKRIKWLKWPHLLYDTLDRDILVFLSIEGSIVRLKLFWGVKRTAYLNLITAPKKLTMLHSLSCLRDTKS